MSLLTWNDSLSVGVPQFDEHHKKLIKLVNDYVDAIKANKGNEQLIPLIAALYDYTLMHFKAEEEFFAKIHYPSTEAHKKEHEGLAKKVLEYHLNIKNNKPVDSLAVLYFLKDWLMKHINFSDKEYGKFYHEKTTA